jgi:hypothetical protein
MAAKHLGSSVIAAVLAAWLAQQESVYGELPRGNRGHSAGPENRSGVEITSGNDAWQIPPERAAQEQAMTPLGVPSPPHQLTPAPLLPFHPNRQLMPSPTVPTTPRMDGGRAGR